MTQLAAYLGTGSAVVFAGIAVWLAIRGIRAERDRSAAVIAKSEADEAKLNAEHAAQNMTVERDVAIKARQETQKRLDNCRAENRRLFDALRKAGAAGAGDVFDDIVGSLHANANSGGEGPGPDGGA